MKIININLDYESSKYGVFSIYSLDVKMGKKIKRFYRRGKNLYRGSYMNVIPLNKAKKLEKLFQKWIKKGGKKG